MLDRLRKQVIVGIFACAAATSLASLAEAAGECRFKPLRPVILKDMGPCNFDPVTRRFAGSADEQASCLLRPVLTSGKIGAPLETLPDVFANHVGEANDLPNRLALYSLLESRGLDAVFGANYGQPVSHVEPPPPPPAVDESRPSDESSPAAEPDVTSSLPPTIVPLPKPRPPINIQVAQNGPPASQFVMSQPAPPQKPEGQSQANPPPEEQTWYPAAYFVIHDTSGPNYRGQPWPDNINDTARLNNLENYSCSNRIERAHVFINRSGSALLAHDFEIPWRATKFESAVTFGLALKGRFLHVELIQPRRREPGYGSDNDFQAPTPGFTQAQYDTLALVYMVASVRAGRWLIPAYHAVIDDGIYDKHDDPQNFELEKFTQTIAYFKAVVRNRS
jgi:hypothetical protein